MPSAWLCCPWPQALRATLRFLDQIFRRLDLALGPVTCMGVARIAGLYMCEQERAADRQSTAFGAVRLYATHTLCISCLAVCCQFHRRLVRFNRWCIERAGSFAVVR